MTRRPISDPLTVAYTPTIANTDFLPSTLTSGDSTPIDLRFTQVSPSTDWTARIPIQLKAVDNIDTPDGSVKVALDTPAGDAGYAITTGAGTGLTVSILDTDIPSFSIDDAEVTYHGEYAEFTITSSIETTQPHTLVVNPANTARDFLDPDDGASGMDRKIENVRFAQSAESQPFTYNLRIKTKTDTTHFETGTISVELKENSQADTYNLTPNENTASVTVYRLTTLSIAPPNSSVNEGGTLEFTVTATYDPRTSTTPLSVEFTPSVENGNFLDENIKLDMSNFAPLTFTQASPSADWTAKLPVLLHSKNEIDTDNGKVKITLNQASNPTYLVAANPNNNATATILDVDIPTISITDAPAVFAGTDAQFTLTSSIQSTRTHAIMIKPANSTGSFLDVTDGASNAPRPIQNVNFSTTGQPFTYTLAIPTKIDSSIASGKITVELVADSDPKEYEIPSNATERTATVTVNNQITLSISAPDSIITEGGTLEFTVTADFDPERALTVKYTPTEVGTDYLNTSVTSGTPDTIDLTFRKDPPATDWTAKIPISLRAQNTAVTNRGEISVTLDQPAENAGYIVATAPRNKATATIGDANKPVLSITDAADSIAGNDAEFTITSHINLSEPLTIMVKPNNTSGNFLDETDGATNTVRTINNVSFSQSGTNQAFTYTLAIPTKVDNSNVSGTISVELVSIPDSANYSLDTKNSSAMVSVFNKSTLSIAAPESTITEGGELNFVVTASYDPRTPLSFSYTLTEESGNYLHDLATPGVNNSGDLTFTQDSSTAPWTANLPIQLRDEDGLDADHGLVKVVLDTPAASANYLVADSPDNEATVEIRDKEIPTISITNANDLIAGNNAVFTLTSDIQPWQPLSINMIPTNTTGKFLNDTAGESATPRSFENVSFVQSASSQTFTATIEIPTINDEAATTGVITVTLVEATDPNNYKISDNLSEQTATVSILNSDEVPILSISSPSINEGNEQGATTDLVFELTLSKSLEYSLFINYRVSDYEGTASPARRETDFRLNSGSLEIIPGTTSGTITARIIHDNDIELDEEFQITISVAEDALIYIPNPIGIGRILDDDKEVDDPPFVYIRSTTPEIDEGQQAMFTIHAQRPEGNSAAITNIQIQVSDTEQYIGWRAPRSIYIVSGEDAYDLSITTLDNNEIGPDGVIRVTILDGEGYVTNSDDGTASVKVNDDDAGKSQTDDENPRISIAQSVVNKILREIDQLLPNVQQTPQYTAVIQPTISVVASTPIITEGESAEFDIVVEDNLSGNLVVSFAVSQNGDFLTPQTPTQVQIPSGTSRAEVIVNTQDDQIAEGDGTITLQLQHHNTYVISTQSSATIAVSDAVDRQNRKAEIASRTSEIFPEILNLIGNDTLTTTSQRIQQAQDGTRSPASYSINGASGIRQIITTSGEMLNSEPESLRSILGNSEFAFEVYSEDYLANPVSVWGIGELKAVNSNGSTSDSSWQGDAFTGHLGFDTKLSPTTLMGMTTSVVDMDAKYALARSNEFLFQLRNTTFNPYLNWTSPNHDAELQTIIGYGLGTIDIKQPSYQYETLQSQSSTISVSGNKRLYSSDSLLAGGTSTLSLIGESWMARLQVEEQQDIIDAVNLNAQHHRIAIDASHNINLISGTSILPSFSIGALYDGKDQDALQGLELRNGISYSNPIGLELTGNTRLIFEQFSQERLWNLYGSLQYDYGNDQLGAILSASGNYIHAPENYSDILNMSILDGARASSMDNTVNTELKYGLSMCGQVCLITPYVGYDLTVNKPLKSRLGTRISVGSLLNLEYEHIYNPTSEIATNQKIQLRSQISW